MIIPVHVAKRVMLTMVMTMFMLHDLVGIGIVDVIALLSYCLTNKNIPIPSMHGMIIYIWLRFMANVGKYTSPMDASWVCFGESSNVAMQSILPQSVFFVIMAWLPQLSKRSVAVAGFC